MPTDRRLPHRHRRPAALARFAGPRLVAGALLVTACAQGAAPDGDPATAAAVGAGDARLVLSPGAAVMVRDPAEVGPRDPIRITAARIDGDSLRLRVETGGGCARHVLRLAVADAFLESYPVQVTATLGHDARGDACRAILRADLAASLAPLADSYRRAYGTRSGVVVLRLDGWPDGLRYAF